MKIESQFIGSSFIEEDLCDNLIRYFYSWIHEAAPGTIGLNSGKKPSSADINYDVKNSLDLLIGDIDLQEAYYNSLKRNLVDDYKKEYSCSDDNAPWGIIQDSQIQKYPIKNGGFKAWHCERSSGVVQPNASRHLVYMTYLNDINDGGETEFLYQNLKIKPKKGLSLVWPADWTFTHRGNSAPSEEKYIVTGWFNYLE